MADIITNLVGVITSLLTTNFSHEVLKPMPCLLCDTPHAYELVQVQNVWWRKTVAVVAEDGRVTPMEAGKPYLHAALHLTNLVQLHHPHAMPVPGAQLISLERAGPVVDLRRLEPFQTLTGRAEPPIPTPAFVPRASLQRAYVVPPATNQPPLP